MEFTFKDFLSIFEDDDRVGDGIIKVINEEVRGRNERFKREANKRE